MKQPIHVCVTGAAGQIAYSLLVHVCSGYIFGDDQPVIVHLLDLPVMANTLKGVVMELDDCAFPLVRELVVCTDPESGFRDCDAALLVGAMPRKKGMERKDLLTANASIFKSQGEAIEKVAKKTIKIVVVGNPANTNAAIVHKYAPSVSSRNISALTRLDHHRAQAHIAQQLKVNAQDVKNVIIWGNHSNTQVPDHNHSYAESPKGQIDVKTAVSNEFVQEFISVVQNRGAAVIAARQLSSALSAAKATADHMKDWWQGRKSQDYFSMAVVSDGSYGVPSGIVFSFPVTLSGGDYSIVQGLSWTDSVKEKIAKTLKELEDEYRDAVAFLNQ